MAWLLLWGFHSCLQAERQCVCVCVCVWEYSLVTAQDPLPQTHSRSVSPETCSPSLPETCSPSLPETCLHLVYLRPAHLVYQRRIPTWDVLVLGGAVVGGEYGLQDGGHQCTGEKQHLSTSEIPLGYNTQENQWDNISAPLQRNQHIGLGYNTQENQ